MFFTYIHRKVTDNSVFYVGCGAKRRMTVTQGLNTRSDDWHKVAKESGWYAEPVAQWDNREDALSHERLLILCFKDMGHPLVNKPVGVKKGQKLGPHSATHKENLRKSLMGHAVSKESRQKMSEFGKGVARPKPLHICLECGKVSTSQWILRHQTKDNHAGKVQL